MTHPAKNYNAAIVDQAQAATSFSFNDYLALFFNPRVLAVLFLGFASGLPLALSTSTLQAWFTVSGIDIVTIGILGLAGMPYLWKFLWAPLMDRYVPPLFGRRRGWVLVTQAALIAILVFMSTLHPQHQTLLLAILALAMAFASASQDIVINAYSTEVLRPHERGIGAAMMIAGYRIAMLVSGGLALIFADHLGWHMTYLLMAAFMSIGVVAAIFGPEPEKQAAPPTNLLAATIEPIKEFILRKDSLIIISMIVLYKIGDAFALSLTSTFLIRGLGFSLTDVGVINKFMTIIGSVIGVFVGGVGMARLGLYRSLMIFGILQAVSNFLYMLLAIVGKSFYFASFAIFFENFCGGMAMAAFLAFIMALCDRRFTAFQFALLTALASIGRVFAGPIAGVLVEHFGWVHFYFMTVIFALPGLGFLWFMRRNRVFADTVYKKEEHATS